MIISTTGFIYALKALVTGSTFFVWVVRYKNIIKEFKVYGLPIWLRDLVGALKLSFVIMMFSADLSIVIFGSFGIASLMFAALITHLRIKNPIYDYPIISTNLSYLNLVHKYLHKNKNNCNIDIFTICSIAAKKGYLNCLQFLHKNGYPWDQLPKKGLHWIDQALYEEEIDNYKKVK